MISHFPKYADDSYLSVLLLGMWWSQPKSVSDDASVGCGFHVQNPCGCRFVTRSKL